MKKNDKRVIILFKSLLEQKLKIHEIRVFGSRARGDESEDSDLDVLVVTDILNHSIEKTISDCAWEAGFYNDIVIVPVPITINSLRNSPLRESVFIQNVYKDGIAL